MPNVLRFTPPAGNASSVWSGRAAPGITTLLFLNTDLDNYAYVGNQPNITADDDSTIPIAPNGTFSADPASPWYLIGAQAGQKPLVMVPNGQGYFLGVTQGYGQLAIPSIRSPNYVTTVSGWAIFKDGSAEFNNVTIRGGVIVSGSEFDYNGTPALDNLVYSRSVLPGKDAYGNWYLNGAVEYGFNSVDGAGYLAAQLLDGEFTIWSCPATMGGASSPWVIQGSLFWDNHQGLCLISESSSLLITGEPVAFNTSAPVKVTDTGDGNVYGIQRLSDILGSDTAPLTALTPVFAANVDVRRYRYRAQLYVNAAAGAEIEIGIQSTAGSAGALGYTVSRGTAFTGTVTGGVNSPLTLAVALSALNGYLVTLEGTLLPGSAGTVNLLAGSATANAIVVASQSTFDLWPA